MAYEKKGLQWSVPTGDPRRTKGMRTDGAGLGGDEGAGLDGKPMNRKFCKFFTQGI